jgi:hypothetical protein
VRRWRERKLAQISSCCPEQDERTLVGVVESGAERPAG